jgi:2,3-bisphosphoglycerate-independent phosphoglycerate mutase
MDQKKPCMLMILDGWGIGAEDEKNAIYLARTPNLDRLTKNYPHTRLICHGEAVGLPEGIMGNSEVGHLNIGAGRVVYQDLVRIDKSIRDGAFFKNPVFSSVLEKVKSNQSALHLIGLVSDGGVHSQLSHLFALLEMARQHRIERVLVHAILDGRDTPPESGMGYVRRLAERIHGLGIGKVATVCGRFYAMDRDTRWDRTEKAWQMYTRGRGGMETDPVEAVKNAYLRKETDEFVQPTIITDKDKVPLGLIRDRDGVIFFNFRADRARQITRAFTGPDFDCFKREVFPRLCGYACMTLYDAHFGLPVAFPPVHLTDILGDTVSRNNLRQLRIAETEKYAHVTYFFNGGEEKSFSLEDRCLIPSPRDVATYDLKPEMSASEVTREVISRINADLYDLIVLNFANMDMVGHTGILDAAVRACETLDKCVGEVVSSVLAKNGVVLITADHGNAEQMRDENNQPHTAHTLNPVPFILVDECRRSMLLRQGVLGDIAPTVLEILGIDPPEAMTGKSLIVLPEKEMIRMETVVDFVTQKEIPLVGAEENRQAVEKFLVNDRGFLKEDIEVNADLSFTVNNEPYCSTIDLVVSAGGRRFMAIRCAAGSLCSRERETLAAARLLDIPYGVVSDGKTAVALEAWTGKKVREGLSSLWSKQDAMDALKEHNKPMALPEERLEKERLIFRSYDAMNVNVIRKK